MKEMLYERTHIATLSKVERQA